MIAVLTICHAGELRIYNEKQLVSTTKMPSPVGAMVFGRYGREEHALISILTSGAPGEVQPWGLDSVAGWEASCHCCGWNTHPLVSILKTLCQWGMLADLDVRSTLALAHSDLRWAC